MNTTYRVHDGDLYDYTSGCLCGVLVDEFVMKKLAKLQAKHLSDVKKVLLRGAEKGRVHSSMWSLHYPNGDQTSVHYIDTSTDVKDRIKSGTTGNKPIHHPLVFIAGSMDEAREMADVHYVTVGPIKKPVDHDDE